MIVSQKQEEDSSMRDQFLRGEKVMDESLKRIRQEEEKQRELMRLDRERERELQIIRDAYLGKKQNRKKVIKPSEKFSRIFQFDWDAGDDTTQGAEYLKQSTRPHLLFGRGYVAGIDFREQVL